MSALAGERTVLARGGEGFPSALENVAQPPDRLYVVGDPFALQEGIAIVGARRATPYGRGCAKRFAALAARRGIVVVSGGARGCDAAAHAAALEEGGRTVAFLGGGCDRLYPAEHEGLFQRIVDGGGAVVSEHVWDEDPKPYRFRLRNRLIAGLARATLIVEAGLPSGTFSTADEALAANRDVLVVPGAITAASSRGANRLIYQGATPVIDDETFEDALFSLFGCLKQETVPSVEDVYKRQTKSSASTRSFPATRRSPTRATAATDPPSPTSCAPTTSATAIRSSTRSPSAACRTRRRCSWPPRATTSAPVSRTRWRWRRSPAPSLARWG